MPWDAITFIFLFMAVTAWVIGRRYKQKCDRFFEEESCTSDHEIVVFSKKVRNRGVGRCTI